MESLFTLGGTRTRSWPWYTTQAFLAVIWAVLTGQLLYWIGSVVEELSLLKNVADFRTMMWLSVILAVHEFGHVYWLRRFSVPVLGPIPIPLLGAMTINGRRLSKREAIMVHLGGPFTGFMALPAAFVGIIARNDQMVVLALFWLFLNLIQLIPMYPSDGGVTMVVLLSTFIGDKYAKVAGYLTTFALFLGAFLLSEMKVVMFLFLFLTAVILVTDRAATHVFERHLSSDNTGKVDESSLSSRLVLLTLAYLFLAVTYLGGAIALCWMYIT
jgi:hypothetical protein